MTALKFQDENKKTAKRQDESEKKIKLKIIQIIFETKR